MQQNNWDVAGFSENGSGNVDAIIKRSKIEQLGDNTLQAACESLDIGLLVAGQSLILDALPRIVENERLYVFGKDGVDRLVTLADLSKQQVRLLIFGLISSLEVRLLEWIRRENLSNDDLSRELGDRVNIARRTLEERKKKAEDTDLLDCLMFIDKVNLTRSLSVNSLLYSHWGKKKLDLVFDRIQRLRNDISHAHGPSEQVTWPAIVEALDIIESIMAVPMPEV
ncbi:hypothetical protein OAG76_01775 [Rubripirellula sp.]|nr:hypothetical protein [Rubripirellula sp.]MDB4634112.1 hypothetical protein [Rubripirellula sp.]